jgi:hypothetical protein
MKELVERLRRILPGVILPKIVLGNEMLASLKVFPKRSNKKEVGSSR